MGAASPLRTFWEFVRSYKTVPAWVAKASVAGPLVNIVTGLGPPWPAVGGVSLLTAMMEVVSLMVVFQYLRGHNLPVKRLEPHLKRIGICLIASLAAYLLVFKVFTFYDYDNKKWAAKGFLREDELAEAMQKNAPDPGVAAIDLTKVITEKSSDRKLLELAGYDARLVYRGWTVDVIEYVLLLAWLTFFSSLAGFVGVFIVLQEKKKPKVAARPTRRGRAGADPGEVPSSPEPSPATPGRPGPPEESGPRSAPDTPDALTSG